MSGFWAALLVTAMKAARMARALNIMVILVVGFLLTMHHPTLAQSLDEATALTQQVIELTKQGRYSEAIPLAERALAIREMVLGPDHPNNVPWLTKYQTEAARPSDLRGHG